MTRLKRLSLRFNSITDMNPLREMTSLEHVSLSGNRIERWYSIPNGVVIGRPER
jgi:Leucine-rich repeat (LRR) protein